ncbi:PIG-L deacetylase family protein [Paracoccus spongiarum]|uniref:PIG-L deacetylase family protein n=1 Tax=Paracoccus spongiarum TaxID=3064387 RepID=A0ABT9JCI6_9RHOB|nr:PIG-L deacetylase family protein [Paracoccus sp. 2205BS29-5]MDP5307518.1 PIG-L deacetylase family protein [Paracoccus sp. 2205BS29-5]
MTDDRGERIVMTVFAHPDDAELCCFGLLAKLRKSGWRVVLVIATLGENGADATAWSREAEARAAAEGLGAEIVFGQFRDGYVPRSAELVGWVEALLEAYRPQMIISHFSGDSRTTHQDHAAVEAAAQIAARRAWWRPTLLLAEGLDNDVSFRPNWFVDITDEFASKMIAIGLHASQGGKYYMAPDYLEVRARKWSLNFRIPPGQPLSKCYWEAFQLVQHAI